MLPDHDAPRPGSAAINLNLRYHVAAPLLCACACVIDSGAPRCQPSFAATKLSTGGDGRSVTATFTVCQCTETAENRTNQKSRRWAKRNRRSVTAGPRPRARPDIICLHEQWAANLSNVAMGAIPRSGAAQPRGQNKRVCSNLRSLALAHLWRGRTRQPHLPARL